MTRSLLCAGTALLALVLVGAAAGCPAGPRSTLILNASLLDGTGAPARQASVRIVGDRIAAVGELAASPRDSVFDAGGLALAPGFIDTHSHADAELAEHPDALAAVSQGITSVIVGQDGDSPHPLADFFARLEREGVAVNVASYAGSGTLRGLVLGDDFRRPATPDEVERMRALLRAELEAGALGLGTGLEYEPGLYSSAEEVLALAHEAARYGGRYISHLRSEDLRFWEALDEILRIGRETGMPVQISHLKLALRRDRGETQRLLGILDAARRAGIEISADVYPYTYWESTLAVLFPQRDFENREVAAFALSEVTTPETAYLAEYRPRPEYVGKTLRELAELRGVDPPTLLIELIREAEAFRRETAEEEVERVIATSMDDADVEQLLAWPHTNLCTDGSLAGSHPRGFGSYPRFLGRYVRERRIMDLATAVHKASGLAAAHMGIRDRGVIAPGMRADLVLFDPEQVLDLATPEDPHAVSVGIRAVFVNGVPVYQNGRSSGRLPGQVIRRQGKAAVRGRGRWRRQGARGINRRTPASGRGERGSGAGGGAMKKDILQRLAEGPVLGDGGYLLELEKRGWVQAGPFTPEVSLLHPEAVAELHREFLHAGAEVLTTLTFYASDDKLATVGLQGRVEEINRAAVRIANGVAAGSDALVAGNISLTWMYDPADAKSADRVRELFDRQLGWQVEEGVDLVIGETFSALGEALLAVERIKAAGKVAMVTMSFEQEPKSVEGYGPGECARRLADAGAEIVGINCLRNPTTTLPLMQEVRAAVDGYVACQPVAYRTPEHTHDFTALPEFPHGLEPLALSRAEMADYAVRARDMGINLIGSCCGSVASHVRSMARALGKLPTEERAWRSTRGKAMSAYEYYGHDSRDARKAERGY